MNTNFDGHRAKKQQGDAYLLPGQVRGYARKSTNGEGASKSLGDQTECIAETAAANGIQIAPADILAEPAGHGGDEWWEGGGQNGLDEGDRRRRTRPVLTNLLKEIVLGEVKAVIVWNVNRLWRSPGICDSLLELFARYNVQLYDRNGRVNFSTPESRTAVRSNAVSAASQREQTGADTQRGIRKNLERGKIATGSDRLGFRSGGRHSKTVLHIHEEQEMVRRIYRMYDVGENGNGPMNFDSIARILRAEGYLWTADLHNKWSRKRNEHTKCLVYDWQIKKALTDCTYQGRQIYAGQEWPCEAYLVDGQPVVPTDLWERVQARIHSEKRVGNAGQVRRAMTGLLRCGLCGQGLNVHSGTASLADGTKKTYAYWINPKSESWCWCTHKLLILG